MGFENWMREMSEINDRPLKDIVIPGSHDAGSYIMRDVEDNVSALTQAVNISGQLLAGSRYLDLRAWHFNNDWIIYKFTHEDGTQVKSEDNWFMMYHGITWAWVSLRHDFVYKGETNKSVVSQIRSFLEDHRDEVVVVTLEIMLKEGVWDSEGWTAVCNDLQDIAVIPVGGTNDQQKNFDDMGIPDGNIALATPSMLRARGKRLVLLPNESMKQHEIRLAKHIDRAGVYAGSVDPAECEKAFYKYAVPKNSMWIFHLGMPFAGDGNITRNLRKLNQISRDYFLPRFNGETNRTGWLTRPLNVINVDYIHEKWVEPIVNLNKHYPKGLEFGGPGGNEFADDLTEASRLEEVTIRAGTRVDSIQCKWSKKDGTIFSGKPHGGTGGNDKTFSLKPGEYISRVEGRSGAKIDQLTFTTNRGAEYGPFGQGGGTPFIIDNIVLGGFFGRSGDELDAVGFFVADPKGSTNFRRYI